MRAVLKNLNKNHSNDNNNFDLIHHLYLKIDKLRNASFDMFPAMDHSSFSAGPKTEIKHAAAINENAKYKWITFYRNMSWFIFRYNSYKIIKHDETEMINDSPYDYLKIDSGQIRIIDLLSKYKLSTSNYPEYFILIEYRNQTLCYAADRPGKRIFSESDVISPKITPFKKTRKYKGRVRIFGKNHIYM